MNRQFLLIAALVGVFLWVDLGLAEEVAPSAPLNRRSYDVSSYVGMQFNPAQPALGLAGDLYLNRYLSLGSLLQVGFWDTRTFLTIGGGGSFHFDLPFKDWEFQLPAQIAYFYRRAGGFEFDNFAFITGVGVDYFVKKPWAASLLLLANVTSDTVDDLFLSTLLGIKYSF